MSGKRDKGKGKVEDTTSSKGLGVNKTVKKRTRGEIGIKINDGSNANADTGKGYAAGSSAGNGNKVSPENMNKRVLRPQKSREGDNILDERTKGKKPVSISSEAEKLVVEGKNPAKRRIIDEDKTWKFGGSDRVLRSQSAKQGHKTEHEKGGRKKSVGKKMGSADFPQNAAVTSKSRTPVKRGTTTGKVKHNLQANKRLLRSSKARKVVRNVDEKSKKKKSVAKSAKHGDKSLHKNANGKISVGKKTGRNDRKKNPVSETPSSSTTPSKRVLRSSTARKVVRIVDNRNKKKSVARTDSGKKSGTTSTNAGKVALKAKKQVKGHGRLLRSQTPKQGGETVQKKGKGKKSVAKIACATNVQQNAGKRRNSDKGMVASSSNTARTPAKRGITRQGFKVKHNSQGSERVLRSTSRKEERIADEKSKRKK